jgi:hypothetical protein
MEHEGFAELANIEDNLIIRDASNGASMLQISDGNSHQFRPSITFQLSVSFASCLQACFFRHLSHLHLFLERWLGGGLRRMTCSQNSKLQSILNILQVTSGNSRNWRVSKSKR